MEEKLRYYYDQLSHLSDKEKIADAMRVLFQQEICNAVVERGTDIEHLDKALKAFNFRNECKFIVCQLEHFSKNGTFDLTNSDYYNRVSQEKTTVILETLTELFVTATPA